jgi:hypothetical protein
MTLTVSLCVQSTMHACCVGNCLDEIARYCSSVDPGDGKLADCVSDQIAESEVANDGELALH